MTLGLRHVPVWERTNSSTRLQGVFTGQAFKTGSGPDRALKIRCSIKGAAKHIYMCLICLLQTSTDHKASLPTMSCQPSVILSYQVSSSRVITACCLSCQWISRNVQVRQMKDGLLPWYRKEFTQNGGNTQQNIRSSEHCVSPSRHDLGPLGASSNDNLTLRFSRFLVST